MQGLGLRRIRAGARLRGCHRVAHRLSAVEYVLRIVQGQRGDPTLSFQLRQGFAVLGVAPGYLRHDPESLGWAAVIEWRNPDAAPDGAGQRGTMPAHDVASGGSARPTDDTTTRAGDASVPGTTANSAA